MSGETWEILQNMEMEDVELQMALQCAPVITGIKISNLLSIQIQGYHRMVDIVKGSGISVYTLGVTKDRVTIFLYHEERLKHFLKQENVQALMRTLGYGDEPLQEIIAAFRQRYQRYLQNREWFPHEMGLLLGYPPEDVEGFIRYQGKNFLCTGYWKVYANPIAKQQLFRRFEYAREQLIQLLSGGMHMREIMAIYSTRREACISG